MAPQPTARPPPPEAINQEAAPRPGGDFFSGYLEFEMLDEIRSRVGDDPKDWMPLLGQAVRDLKARQTGAR